MTRAARSGCLALSLLLILGGMAGWAAGCTASPADTTAPAESAAATAESGTVPETTAALPTAAQGSITSGKPNAASGVLRLWWSKRKNLNPLLDGSQSGQAVSRLIYQGLFAIAADQQAQPVLASQISLSEDGLQATIQLKAGLAFHNGQPLQAGDVVACLNYIQANAAVSPYAAALGGILAAEAPDASTVRLTLGQPDPWLAWALVFPVIPAARLNGKAFDLVAGTGPFRMVSYQPGQGTMLAKVNPGGAVSELTSIRVLEFADLSAAMQAFEADGLDLVSLSAGDYNRYRLRNSLRYDQYIGNECLFLSYNTQKRRPLADAGKLLFLKQLLLPDRLSLDGAGEWGECTAVPQPAASWLLGSGEQSAAQRSILASLGGSTWDPATRELVFLLPDSDAFYQDLAALIGARLSAAGVKWRLKAVPEADYPGTLQQGQYDLALLKAVMPDTPDATWLYRDDPPAAFALLTSLPAGSLADYPVWRQRLLLANAAGGSVVEGLTYSNILNETAARSVWSVLLLRSSAVLYGSRVIGQCRPDRYNPYRGIEELWIWSGQSS